MVYGTYLATKMMSNDKSPLEQCDHQVKLYTNIHFIGPLDLVLISSRILLQLQVRYIDKQVVGNSLFQDSN